MASYFLSKVYKAKFAVRFSEILITPCSLFSINNSFVSQFFKSVELLVFETLSHFRLFFNFWGAFNVETRTTTQRKSKAILYFSLNVRGF